MAASLPYEGTVFPNSCNLFLESQSFKQSLRRDFCIYGTRKNRCYHPNAVPHCGFVCNFRSRKCRVSGDSSVRSWQEILFMGSRRIVGVFAYSEAGITSLFAEENGDDGLHNFEDAESKDYPMVRSYENDLCRLTLIGNRSFEEAITAAAADGGVTAAEHIASGRPLMVIETIYPGHCSEHSTVSTRLLVPAMKVAEKAKTLCTTMRSNRQSDTSSRNVLAKAFRKVVMQHMWNFELLFFNPGTYRDMTDLSSPREVGLAGSLNSSDERFLTGLAEAVCSYAAACMKDNFYKKMLGRSSKNLLQSFQGPKWMVSSDSYVRVCLLPQAEIAASVKTQLERTRLIQGREKHRELGASRNWWPMPITSSSLHKICGIESDAWINEYIPVHKLQIDVSKFKNVKFHGGQKYPNHVWEILLSHLQMVELADVLDMYYVDPQTCPGKQLRSRIILESPKFVTSKITLSLWRALYALLVSGVALVSVIVATRFWKPNIVKLGAFSPNSMVMSSSIENIDKDLANQPNKPASPQNEEVPAEEMEASCTWVVQMVKDALQWPDDIKNCAGDGAWMGQDLTEWARLENKIQTTTVIADGSSSSTKEVEDMDESGGEDGLKRGVAPVGDILSQDRMGGTEKGSDTHDIAIYEVVLSRNRNLLGFKPTNRAAVNQWANNPIAKTLYEGRKLRPGLLEPRLKYRRLPKDTVVVELLMSDSPASRFVFARPCRT